MNKKKKHNKENKTPENPTLAEFIADDKLDSLPLDPHVRIVGRKEDVLRSKDKVMAVLDAKVNRLDSSQILFPLLKLFFFHVFAGQSSHHEDGRVVY